ncbi:MAG: hypothetical protein M5U34_27865 [Chloroflexi bacterium]|nr:hypothetical protein [Chloroflexota bacterium]
MALAEDPYAFYFVDLKDKESIGRESLINIYKRTLQQDEASAWILRFFTHKNYQKAIAFADAIDEAVKNKISDETVRKAGTAVSYGASG